jgi:hypothetical protein
MGCSVDTINRIMIGQVTLDRVMIIAQLGATRKLLWKSIKDTHQFT